MNISTEEILKHFPSFEKTLAEEISQRGEIKNFQEGEFLMRTGQYIRSTMLVLEGLVKIYREDDEGNERRQQRQNSHDDSGHEPRHT